MLLQGCKALGGSTSAAMRRVALQAQASRSTQKKHAARHKRVEEMAAEAVRLSRKEQRVVSALQRAAAGGAGAQGGAAKGAVGAAQGRGRSRPAPLAGPCAHDSAARRPAKDPKGQAAERGHASALPGAVSGGAQGCTHKRGREELLAARVPEVAAPQAQSAHGQTGANGRNECEKRDVVVPRDHVHQGHDQLADALGPGGDTGMKGSGKKRRRSMASASQPQHVAVHTTALENARGSGTECVADSSCSPQEPLPRAVRAQGTARSAAANGKLTGMQQKLAGGRFRMLNQKLYTVSGEDAFAEMQVRHTARRRHIDGAALPRAT